MKSMSTFKWCISPTTHFLHPPCFGTMAAAAMRVLDNMERYKLRANSINYVALIKCCISNGAIMEGKRIHRHVFANGYTPDAFVLTSLLNMYGKFKLLDDAQALFDQMPERSVVSWNTMIAAYAGAKVNDKALQTLVMMLRDGARPDEYTFSSVLRACWGFSDLKQIHCCIIKAGLELDIFVRTALISTYSGFGEMGSSLKVFDERVTSDLVVWNSIIGGFSQNSDGDEALNLFKRMKRFGVWADLPTMSSVLRACTSLALLEIGRQVHVHVVKFRGDLVTNNALLDMYCKSGSLEDANRIFTRMGVKDVISWSTMIIGFAQNGYSRKALDLFEAMKVSGMKPNHVTILGVLFACSHAGLVNDGIYYFESMKRLYGIDPHKWHYNCMVDLLGRAEKLDEAVELINEMKCEPDVVTWKLLLGACRVHSKMDLAELAAKRVLSLDPNDAETHIVLSNMYANSQRWEDAENLRKIMKDGGIKKEPGCSWIEIDKQIHSFIFGDKSHPHSKFIYEELSRIIWRLKGEGYVPDTNFVLHDLEGEQMETSLSHHSEKLAIVFGLMRLPKQKTVRIRKNLRICGDCHVFAKMVSKMENRRIVIRDTVRYHHFEKGCCSCDDYW